MTIHTLNKLCENSLISHLGIQFTHIDHTTIKAIMPVDERTKQPFNFLHGGASLALAETLASAGSVALLKDADQVVFGVSVSAQHTNSVRVGSEVIGIAKLLKEGKTLHTWEVKIFDNNDNLVSNCMVTNAIVDKTKKQG